jgi:hypothetical protein
MEPMKKFNRPAEKFGGKVHHLFKRKRMQLLKREKMQLLQRKQSNYFLIERFKQIGTG